MSAKAALLTPQALVKQLGAISLADAVEPEDIQKMLPPSKAVFDASQLARLDVALREQLSLVLSDRPIRLSFVDASSQQRLWTEEEMWSFLEPELSRGLVAFSRNFPNNPRTAKALLILLSKKLATTADTRALLEMADTAVAAQVEKLASDKSAQMAFIAKRYKSGYHAQAAAALAQANRQAIDFQQKIAAE